MISDRGDAVEAVVTGRWTQEAARAFETGRAQRLVLNYALGFDEPSLDFLAGLPIRDLVVLDRRLPDLSPIHSLGTTLELLHVTSDPRLMLDLSRLPRLRELNADWTQVSRSIAAAGRLRVARLGSYTPHDLSPLTSLRELSVISMKDRPRLRSLAGLSELVALRKLGVFLAKDLAHIAELRDRPELEELQLQSCRKINQVDDVAGCPSLRMLNLSECGDIATLRPISHLSELEDLALFGTTKVLDGDLTPIAGLPRLKQLRMQSRRSYRPSVEEIQAQLPRG